MNLCFVMGKIISDINYKFVINDKKIKSVVIFEFKLNSDTRIPVIGHNKKADICYSRLRKYDNIYIYGLINSNGQIEIREIYFQKKYKSIKQK